MFVDDGTRGTILRKYRVLDVSNTNPHEVCMTKPCSQYVHLTCRVALQAHVVTLHIIPNPCKVTARSDRSVLFALGSLFLQ